MRYIGDTCEVTCEDTGRIVTAELLDFVENRKLSVSINRSIRLDLRYNGRVYHGESRGLTFLSPGPQITETKNTR